MSELLLWYIIFAVTTTITANILLLSPIIDKLKELSDNPGAVLVLKGKWLLYLIFNVTTLVLAPAIFVGMIIERKKQDFIQGFVNGIIQNDKS